jgi:predicted phage terminase large subunit-like protein
VPADGNLVKREWLKRYSTAPERQPGDMIVQSWDCASKDGISNDWSVCITALVRGPYYYILDVYRERLQFPDLYNEVVARARQVQTAVLLVEDAASGTQLIQNLRRLTPQGVVLPTRVLPVGDKIIRMAGASLKIERGEMVLPLEAPWLASFEVELLGFPSARHDDQADALSQLLNWRKDWFENLPPEGPYIISVNDDDADFDDFDDSDDACLY